MLDRLLKQSLLVEVHKFKIIDWTLMLFQCLFIVWGIFNHGKTIHEVYKKLNSPLIPESIPQDISEPHFIMIGFFVFLSFITYVDIRYYSRLKIGLLIGTSLIIEYILTSFIVFKQESLF
jgi:hypothetical protein